MTFKVFSLGCKVNSYECSALSSTLINKGYIEVNDNPDIVIINTCSVTATADQKSRQHIRKFQKMFPHAIIVVMGCYAQGNKDYIINEINPTILVGTSNRDKIPELIEEYLKEKKNIVAVDNDPRVFKYEEMGVTSFSENTRAYLKIQDGCDNFCSYCLIPYRRGKMRSRNKENIISEAKYLVSKGYQEIVLAGIHVGGYGQDLNDLTFSMLVEELLNIEGLKRLRISSIEESEIDEHLIDLVKTRTNLAHHLHIPLQSGSDTVLERMNRKYKKKEFIDKLNHIKQEIPDIALSTDVIVGFPSESDEEFLETVDTIKKCHFDMLHVFPFSSREGTKAAEMKNQIAPNIKQERSKVLLNLSKELWSNYVETQIGHQLSVLIERFDEERKLNIGHSSNYIEVAIPSDSNKVGQYIDITLEKSMIESE